MNGVSSFTSVRGFDHFNTYVHMFTSTYISVVFVNDDGDEIIWLTPLFSMMIQDGNEINMAL